MSHQKGIGTFGSMALLVSSMTGPGLSTIPALFQQSGWVAPVFIFLIVAALSGCSALFVCEALSNIKGNEKFQSKVELTTIAQVYLGKKYHYLFQVLLYLALQAVNVTSIIIAAQTFDSMFITVFKGTCGLGVYPGGWFCVTQADGITGNSPFPDTDYYIFTFGYLLTAVMVIPLGFFSLVENIVVQMISFIVLIAVLIQWCVAFGQEGLKTELLPAIGPNSTMVLGIVVFNYSYITTIPSWVNSLRPDTNIHKSLWISVGVSTIFYLTLGILGAMAYKMDAESDILAILSGHGTTASIVTAYLFPVCALITSIPVFTIVIRDNLLRGDVCTPFKRKAISVLFKTGVVYFFNRPSIRVPDENEVILHDDTCSLSIRRSSLPVSRTSRLESAMNSPNPDHGPVPMIIYSGISTEKLESTLGSPGPDHMPVPTIVYTEGEEEPKPPVYTAEPKKPANSLGISLPNSPSLAVPRSPTNSLGISSPSLLVPRSPELNSTLTVPRSPEISPANRSPSIRSRQASGFSFKPSGLIVPVMEEEDIKQTTEPPLIERFLAFKPRSWFNPFYLALVCCTAFTLAITFMIIYDLVYLSKGNDVFG
ncbi:transmembrane amino acid transporter protein-domain-containing protein [Sporodiniella umbellata]|nr:transmembrane amino acid transporter protein-domain-containing protein [Sporodiniella umbellata]